ncbi:Hypothetical protein ORPV_141 [Orpheovirus IHUMI-LCC2]|uniref:Uncharacterized protein n=1 Tax=Orpheovirus IHUMI-LCC2 TaxID=2023057 RepID=A0A2I2L3B9_9VIRU|nr:Hypothetical protein ORPV_141 [Orpheovirus IHUMI-LCC2]SNW62045.1 Hypothetical protein ORPV_141 [Orpheovirus IHUMI-LCC2]
MDNINLNDIFVLPPETQCDILSNITDVRTLQRIIVSTNDQGFNPLYDIAKNCVIEINRGVDVVEYSENDDGELVRIEDSPNIVESVVHVPILSAYPNVYKVKSIDERRVLVSITDISDMFFLCVHPSLRIGILQFNFITHEEYSYRMIKTFLDNYLNGYNIVNGKKKNINNNFKDKYLLLYGLDETQYDNGYIFICNESLVVHYVHNANYLQILEIIIMLLNTGNFKNVYLSLDWNIIRDNDTITPEHEEITENFYLSLTQLPNPVNIVLNHEVVTGLNYGYIALNIDKANIIYDGDKGDVIKLSKSLHIDEIGGFDELSGPFNVDDCIKLFTYDRKTNPIDIPNYTSLGFILYSTGEKEIDEINKIVNSNMHKKINYITMYVNDRSLYGKVIEKNGRTFIFKPHVNINFDRDEIFKENTANL